MARFDLSREAHLDLSRISEYTTEQWGLSQTRAYLDAMEGRLGDLAKHPLMGRRRDELGHDIFSFPFESHIIFYVPMDFGIAVVRILHKRQDPLKHVE